MRLTPFLQCISKLPKDYSNFPERYIKRAMEQVVWRTPKGPEYQDKVIKRKKFHFTLARPWTEEFKQVNAPGVIRKKVFVEPIKEWVFFRGDRVEILKGKDKGKQGIVIYIVKERNWVLVEGLNCHHKYLGKRPDFPGVLVKTEAPLLVTNEVALVDPSDNKPTTAEFRWTEDGKQVRVSIRTGRIIPIPVMAEETYDYKRKHLYVEKPKDTMPEEVEKITFDPKLMTFEQDIMEAMGKKVECIEPYPTYWY